MTYERKLGTGLKRDIQIETIVKGFVQISPAI